MMMMTRLARGAPTLDATRARRGGATNGTRMVTTTSMSRSRARCAATREDGREGADARAALAAFVAASVVLTSAVVPEAAEAARSGGRVGGGSFRTSSRSRASPSMNAQSRAAPPLVGGYGYGYNSVFMPMPIMPMYGFGFGFGGMGFLFNLFFFMFVLNTILGFVSQMNEQQGRRFDDENDEDDFDRFNRR